MDNFYQVLVLCQEDRDLPLCERDLLMEEEYVYTFYVPTSRGVCAYMDWMDTPIKKYADTREFEFNFD